MLKNKNEDVWVDPKTGLMWQVKIDKEKLLWVETGRYVERLNQINYGGYNDWRVPTRHELETLQTRECHKSKDSFNSEFFIKKPLLHSMNYGYQSFWTSSQADENEDGGPRAFLVNFFSPKSTKHSGYTSYPKSVRCVRH
ncbi:MAG: DUF1566 domain-containing protein [Motiliproteus sp.]